MFDTENVRVSLSQWWTELEKRFDPAKLAGGYIEEDECRSYLGKLRWPDSVTCPRCFYSSISTIVGRGKFFCGSCGYHFSVTSGTVFHGSHLPLWKWFAAIYLMTESEKGVSANRVRRAINVSYKTAWYLCHRIRTAMAEQPYYYHYPGDVVTNQVANEAIAVANADSRIQIVYDKDRTSLHESMRIYPRTGAGDVYSGGQSGHRRIVASRMRPEIIDKGTNLIRGNARTVSGENIWSLLSRSIAHTYHRVSVKHLDAYMDEIEWRLNNLQNRLVFQDTLIRLLHCGNVRYADLTVRSGGDVA